MSIVTLDSIGKKYGQIVVLDHFSLCVEENDYVAIVGKSGAGKSTLLNILGLIETADSGEYRIYGNLVPKLDSREGISLLRNKISYLFQNYALINTMTVKQNIMIGLRFLKLDAKRKNALMYDALEKVGLAGYENKKIYQLSGGEQQRVALARIIHKPTDLILADEPTGNLDAGNRDIVMNILNDLHQSGKTIIVVSHDQNVVRCAKRVVTLERQY